MNYVALLSGGKDSCFNLLHCHANGHNLIAAASLRPPEGIEELDSFLYQSVGQEVIQLIADALDVPLYRGTINGSAIQQSLQYGSNESVEVQGDETEDLYKLLLHVKVRMHALLCPLPTTRTASASGNPSCCCWCDPL
jgi:diphthine-ammonia ligase